MFFLSANLKAKAKKEFISFSMGHEAIFFVPTRMHFHFWPYLINCQEIEKVDWAEPQIEVDEEIMSTVRLFLLKVLKFAFDHVNNSITQSHVV